MRKLAQKDKEHWKTQDKERDTRIALLKKERNQLKEENRHLLSQIEQLKHHNAQLEKETTSKKTQREENPNLTVFKAQLYLKELSDMAKVLAEKAQGYEREMKEEQ